MCAFVGLSAYCRRIHPGPERPERREFNAPEPGFTSASFRRDNRSATGCAGREFFGQKAPRSSRLAVMAPIQPAL